MKVFIINSFLEKIHIESVSKNTNSLIKIQKNNKRVDIKKWSTRLANIEDINLIIELQSYALRFPFQN